LTHSDRPASGAQGIRWIEVSGEPLRVAIQSGSGTSWPLLLLNGLGANLELFRPFIDVLGFEFETISVDLPGVGESPAPRRPYRFSGLAHLLARLLDQLGYTTVDVLGISWGGGLAQEFAHRYPDRCRRLVLVSTGTGALMIPGRPSVLLPLLSPRRYVDASYMASIAAQLYGGKIGSEPDLARKFGLELRSGGTRGYYMQLLAGVGWTSVHWLHKLRQPTLILAGRHDPIVPSINGQIMARLIPNSRLHLFDDGHLGLLTSAAELAPIIREFLLQEMAVVA
jgi:poly(3-hydroxyoctanoate) depolymerase